MKIIVTRPQFDLLLRNLHWLDGKALEMNGKTFKAVVADSRMINERRMFEVELWLGSFNTKVIVQAHNSSEAMYLARKMFPKADVYGANKFKSSFYCN